MEEAVPVELLAPVEDALDEPVVEDPAGVPEDAELPAALDVPATLELLAGRDDGITPALLLPARDDGEPAREEVLADELAGPPEPPLVLPPEDDDEEVPLSGCGPEQATNARARPTLAAALSFMRALVDRAALVGQTPGNCQDNFSGCWRACRGRRRRGRPAHPAGP